MSLSRSSSSRETNSAAAAAPPAVVARQHPASESVQAPDHRVADVPDTDDADGQVAQVLASDTAQPEVVVVRGADDLLGVADRHQDQHQGVVGDAVRCVRHVLDRDAQARGGIAGRCGSTPMLRVEMCSTPAVLQRAKRRRGDLGLVSHADAPVAGRRDDAGLRHGVARDRGHDPEPRRQLVEEVRLVLLAAVDGDVRARWSRVGIRAPGVAVVPVR